MRDDPAPKEPAPREATWEIVSDPEHWDRPELLRDWQRLVDESKNPNRMYQSPAWFGHLRHMAEGDRLALAVARDPSGRTLAVAPLRVARFSLDFHIGGNSLGKIPIRKVFVLGGSPLGPDDGALLEALIRAVLGAFPEAKGVGFPAIQAGTFLWDFLVHSPSVIEQATPYVVDGVREYHLIDLPPTFPEYLARYSSKKRYNLKRQVNILREHGGDLELRPIERPEDLGAYLDASGSLGLIRPNDRGRTHRVLQSVAERGLLCSYLLRCGGEVVGVVGGTHYQGFVCVNSIRYHEDYARFSPGAVMVYLIVEDMITRRSATLLNLGFGEPNQRHHQTNTILDYGTVLLMRRTLTNRLLRASHRAFRSGVAWVKSRYEK